MCVSRHRFDLPNGTTVAQFTGRDDSRNFAGLGTVPPLVIQGEAFTTMFHSDGTSAETVTGGSDGVRLLLDLLGH